MMDRKEFISLTAAAAFSACTGCPVSSARADSAQVLDVGPLSNYAKDGVYDAYRSLGFFVIRSSGNLIARSSLCTHRKVQLTAERDGSFYCKRHGSIFDSNGNVKKGPADRNLPLLTTSVSSAGHLLVHLPIS